MKKYDYLIVGSGLFGSTFAYFAHKNGQKCLVVEKRNHIGGNVFCENIENITVHKYGAHIFHTNNKKIWDFVNNFVPFNRYTNSPIAYNNGNLYNLPFNMNTFHQLWGVNTPNEALEMLNSQKKNALLMLNGSSPSNLEEQALSCVGTDVYNTLIKYYTQKQWGRPCTELPASIIKRIPIRLTYDNNYFNDTYQGIPIGGYNCLINALLQDVPYVTNTDFFKSKYYNWKSYANKLVYTGPIDAYFKFKFGKLDWRTVSFQTRIENTPNYQGNAVINYTDITHPYTRIIEHKHFELFGDKVYSNPKTVITEEYSKEYLDGMEPYYPINDEKNSLILSKYKHLQDKEHNVIFGGRLAEYKYYDMAPTIEAASFYWQNKFF